MSEDRSADEQVQAPVAAEQRRPLLSLTPAHRNLTIRIGAASAIGVITGVVVLAMEHAIDDVLEVLFEQPAWVPAAAVVGGLLVTTLLVQAIGGRTSATTEVYVEEYHRAAPSVEPRHAPGRLLAAFATLASGAPLGMEGPAVYTGTVIAAYARRRWATLLGDAYHAMLIAGAAAGIAAVFKAPAAGAIFAMEVPFRGRLAGERVLPAVFGSATGYLTMASIDGVKPEAELPLVELTYGRAFGSVVLGVVVGVAAIGVIALIERGESLTTRSPWTRTTVAALLLAALYAIGRAATGEPVALASGNAVIDWAIEPDHAVGLLVLVFLLRAAGPAVAIAAGGVGGLFIPLMAAGAVIGRLFADAFRADDVTLYVIVGASTMLGAGYAVPLTAVVFVAEYTGQAGLIVPGLLAVATMRFVVGQRSVSPAQRP